MNNILKLKNGDNIKLEWSFLVLEYLEEYPGGMKALKKDMRSHTHEIKISNYFCYAVINANYEKKVTYEEAIKLIDLKALKQILEFIKKNENEFNEFKKKDQTYLNKKTKKKHLK
ncbi:unknown [Firmicutes bacterium CAG:460]|nr:unknown [Firmicutes bacterium CAG:460]